MLCRRGMTPMLHPTRHLIFLHRSSSKSSTFEHRECRTLFLSQADHGNKTRYFRYSKTRNTARGHSCVRNRDLNGATAHNWARGPRANKRTPPNNEVFMWSCRVQRRQTGAVTTVVSPCEHSEGVLRKCDNHQAPYKGKKHATTYTQHANSMTRSLDP
jgi:hypothetical protein